MYYEYNIEIMLRNLVMTLPLLQDYQLLELKLDQIIGRLLIVFTKWWYQWNSNMEPLQFESEENRVSYERAKDEQGCWAGLWFKFHQM